MMKTTKTLKALGDETRLRMIHVLSLEELSVSELAATLNLGQSRVSGALAILREAELLTERRDGRRSLIRVDLEGSDEGSLVGQVLPEIVSSRAGRLDVENLERVIARRDVGGETPGGSAGVLGARYLPGRTWEGFARALLHLVPHRRIADIGCGDGDMTMLLATFATELFAIDPQESVLARVRNKATRAGRDNVRTLAGPIEELPLEDASVDLAVVSQVLHHTQNPKAALLECARILAPGGTILILDLEAHDENFVKEKLDHRWLGFREEEVAAWLQGAGFEEINVHPVARDRRPPHFVTLLATGRRIG